MLRSYTLKGLLPHRDAEALFSDGIHISFICSFVNRHETILTA
jgi:hypothetical protein